MAISPAEELENLEKSVDKSFDKLDLDLGSAIKNDNPFKALNGMISFVITNAGVLAKMVVPAAKLGADAFKQEMKSFQKDLFTPPAHCTRASSKNC
jgi:hypothetical protein